MAADAAPLNPSVEAGAFRWPLFTDQAINRLELLLAKSWFADSETVEEFEQALRRWLNVKYAITQSSGTSALEAALFAIDLRPGDEVVGPALSYWSCVLPAARFGASIVLVDCEKQRLTICPEAVAQAITPLTRAVIAVHLHGQVARMEELRSICQKRKVPLIEDASHMVGASTSLGKVGTLGDISIFSLNGKVFCCGEGGVLVTNIAEYYSRAVRWGLSDRTLESVTDALSIYRGVSLGGVNSRIANTTAALGLDQLSGINRAFETIDSAMGSLTERIRDSGLVLDSYSTRRGAWHEPFFAAPGFSRDDLLTMAMSCRRRGIDVNALSAKRKPLHRHPWFQPSQDRTRDALLFKPRVLRKSLLTYSELHDGLVLPRLTRNNEAEVIAMALVIKDSIAEVRNRTATGGGGDEDKADIEAG